MTLRTVLMIDDDPDSYDRVRRHLDREIDLHYVSDPYKGIGLARELRPDAIILDLRMEGLDGYDVCRRLRGHAATEEIPIIIYSVDGDRDPAFIRSLDLGAHAVVEKERLSRLEAVLERFAGEESPVASPMHRFHREGHELKIQGEGERVWLDGQERILRPKARRLLACLVARPGVLIHSEELVEGLYEGKEKYNRGPEDIHRLVHDLRAKVEPNPKKPIFVENVRRTGYRLSNEDKGR
jgi:DNA-binding response OmpR family regulator